MNEKISAFLSERVAAGDFPSAVYLVAEKGEIVYHDALGNAVVTPEVIPARLDTIYDLASLTKVLVTGLCLAKLKEKEGLQLDGPVSGATGEQKMPTIRSLVSHTSGLAAWLPLYLFGKGRNEIFDWILSSPELFDRETKTVVYSDLNFILLGSFLEQGFGKKLDFVFYEEVAEQLQLEVTGNDDWYESKGNMAASENGNEYERLMCIERGFLDPKSDRNAFFRHDVIWGEVHDGNAYFMGGVAGHAGLFSTAEEVFKIALQFLPQYTQLLKPETCELFRTNFTKGMNEDRSFAFQLASTKDSTAGTSMSPESFGHNGFTGTSLWIDPVKDRIFILLTNRTHNHPLPFSNINSVRRRFHDIAIEELEKR